MIFEINLAGRFLRSRKRSLQRFTSVVAVFGLAAGVASLVVAQALARGFQNEMRDKILAQTANVTVFLADGSNAVHWRDSREIIRNIEGVVSVEGTDYQHVLLGVAGGAEYALLRATEEAAREDRVQDEISVSVGAELAARAGLQIGDMAEIITPDPTVGARRSSVRVHGTFRTGIFDYDSTWINISQADFVRVTGDTQFSPSILSVKVEDIYSADAVAARIREATSGELRVLDWHEANRPLFAALSLERKAALTIIFLIVFIAALNITTTLSLLVNERRSDIAVLRTCGAKTRSLVFLFLATGLFLGICGIALGLLLGLVACSAANYFRLVSLSPEVYSLSYIPLAPAFWDAACTALGALVLCLLATLYPSFRASKMKPWDDLRPQ